MFLGGDIFSGRPGQAGLGSQVEMHTGVQRVQRRLGWGRQGTRAANGLPSARSLGGLILNKTLSRPQFRGMAVFAPIICGRCCGHHSGLGARGWGNSDLGALGAGSAPNAAGRPGCGPQGLPRGQG